MTRPVMMAVAGILVGLCVAGPADGHVVYGRVSLSELVGGADLVARARIVEPAARLGGAVSGGQRPAVTAELVEIFKGETSPGRVRFAQHGHGVAVFESGTEVLLFLQVIERVRELEALAATNGLRWVSLQAHGAEFELDPSSRAVVTEAIRDYVALESIATTHERADAFRRLTLRLLQSPEERLHASGLLDLIAHADALLTPASAPEFELLVDDPAVALGVRLGVLAELERLGRIDGEPHWARMLNTAENGELVAVIRAARAHPSPAVNAELIRLLQAGDREAAPAAAIALGVPGNREAVGPLTTALEQGDHRSRMAAIRALGAIGLPEAARALEEAADRNPEDEVRRRARAELRRLDARGTDAATPLSPREDSL